MATHRKDMKSSNIAERTQRSVFVGNIPYEATEAQLSELFARAGQVVNFRLMYDRETGRSKGYGFCEFIDKDTAASALRNMNNMEFSGRNLRIDAASGERTKEEIRQMHVLMAAAEEQACYGPSTTGVSACRNITNIMTNLPRDQLLAFLAEMKTSLRTNPNEAKSLLFENPQVSYALLEAAVLCHCITREAALAMLHPPYSSIETHAEAFAKAIVPGMYGSAKSDSVVEEPASNALGKSASVSAGSAAQSTSPSSVQPPSTDYNTALAKFESLDDETKNSIAADLLKTTDQELDLLPAHMKQFIVTLRGRYCHPRS